MPCHGCLHQLWENQAFLLTVLYHQFLQRESMQNCGRYFRMLPGILPDDLRACGNYVLQNQKEGLYTQRPREESVSADRSISQSTYLVLVVPIQCLPFLHSSG